MHRVGTDGVLLGAWADVYNVSNILDIGTGTGVIALMLAQRSKAKIRAIEHDFEPFTIAKENFANSPFRDRLHVQHTSLQDFYTVTPFDLIACNPPFFANSLKPPSINRQHQRHTNTLSPTQLLEHTSRLLSLNGRLTVILPFTEGNLFIDLAKSFGLSLNQSCAVFSKESKPQERWLLEFGKQPGAEPKQGELCIMDSFGQWTTEYKLLTKDFYLNF